MLKVTFLSSLVFLKMSAESSDSVLQATKGEPRRRLPFPLLNGEI